MLSKFVDNYIGSRIDSVLQLANVVCLLRKLPSSSIRVVDSTLSSHYATPDEDAVEAAYESRTASGTKSERILPLEESIQRPTH